MSHEHDIAFVPVAGELTAVSAPSLKQAVESLIAQGCRRIILNFGDVPRVDSYGMAALIVCIRRMRAAGGLISLVNVSPHVLHSLKVARIVDLVPVSEAGRRAGVAELDPSVLPLWRTTLSVHPDDLQAARKRVEELAGSMSFSADDVFDLTLAVGEALGNAADHTCGDGILATVSGYPDRMVVEVCDCGGGFAVPEVEVPCAACAERGRGIHLMELLADAVSIGPRPSGTGTVVRLVKLV